jgi:thioredoxin 1
MMDNSKVTAVNDATFEKEVLAAGVPVLVDFGAKWCAPCRALDPVIAEVAARTSGRIKVVTVDTEEAPGIAQAYGIRAVPTLLLFGKGDKLVRHIGVTTREKLLAMVEDAA